MTPLLTLQVIERMAGRIERAYLRRRPYWHPGCSHARVWVAAASALLQAHEDDPAIPVDPELFVAAQPIASHFAKPWEELTQPTSVRRYRHRVLQIIRRLRYELRAEVRLAEGRVSRGEAVDTVLLSKSRRLSPLGRYIVAHRARRPDIAARFRPRAQDQHRSCPLYRQASLGLLPLDAYPTGDAPRVAAVPAFQVAGVADFSLN